MRLPAALLGRSHLRGFLQVVQHRLDFRQNVFFLFKEALTNIARHAQATVAEARIEQCGGRLRLTLRDNGVGFDMQYADKLFGVFQRLHGVEEFEGAGIGLAIVQQLAQANGWRVWLENRPEGGLAAWVSLPVVPESSDASTA